MTYFKSGSWNAICDVCGFKFKADQMKKRWDGLMVCEKDFEHDHPQKYLKVKEDQTSVPWVRNRPADVFVDSGCDLWDRVLYADYGVADCATGDLLISLERLIELYSPNTKAIAGIGVAGYAVSGVM